MIPHPSSHRPPRPVPPSRGPPSRPVVFPPPEGLPAIDPRLQQSTVIDLTEDEYGDVADIGRPAKRLRLDTGIDPPPLDHHQQFQQQHQHQANPQYRGQSAGGEAPESSINPLDLMNAFSSEQTARPPWSFRREMPRSVAGGTPDSAQWPRSVSLPPLPIRPWKYSPQERYRMGRMGSKDDMECMEVATKPYNIDVPSAAPRFADDKPADFSPWTGSHPEDVLSEQTAKQGFYDRVQVSSNESASAKPSLYPQFKHRSGLKVLSSVFAAALEKRQAHTRITDESKFKPPPRVTITDRRREEWLQSLADPSCPLRSLSRTIPHGIRGKVLLDQCLAKNVPIPRAMWLAKCVGANELRAFKRKGTSAAVASGLEAKWVRDWTVNVEQFIEGVIASFGDATWKFRISYAVRLSARLFLEHLLEQDHFVDWFLTSFDAASLENLPVWLLMVGVYWQSTVRYRRRGKRLAECLLEKLRLAIETDQNGNLSPLIRRLSRLVKTFALTHPSSFILPRTWSKYEGVLQSCLDLTLADDKAALEKIIDRNARVCRIKSDRAKSTGSPHQRLIQLLDSSSDLPTLSTECLNISLDYSVLITRIIEWSSTSFRYGLARIYTAVRLFRRWKKAGIDIDSHILAFLVQNHQKSGVRLLDVYHVISELVRSQSFSVGKYLQWLMARGVDSNVSSSEQRHIPGDIGLLGHLPSRRLPSHIWNLRNTLFSRAGFSVAAESDAIQQAKASIRRRLPNMFAESSPDGDAEMTDDVDLTSFTWTVRSELGQWLRDQVACHVTNNLKSAMDNDFANDIKSSALTPGEFFEVRYIMECLDDLSMLADVLKHASGSDDGTVLASAVDTLDYHFDSFNAIGATIDLFKSFVDAYTRMSKTELPIQDLISSLLNVGIRLPAEMSTVAVLRRDQVQRDRKLAMAASSPVSDHIADTLNTSNPTFTEELDQLLASGNSMDEATLARIFGTLSKRLESGSVGGRQCVNETARYFAQLRTFNAKYFDNLMIKWVIGILKSSPRPILSTILPPLIGVGCVTLHSFYVLAKALLHSESHRNAISDLAELRFNMIQLLDKKVSDENGSQGLVSYRFKIARQEYVKQYSGEALSLTQDLLEEVSKDGAESSLKQGGTDLVNATSIPLLCEIVVRQPGIVGADCADRLLEKFPACMNLTNQALSVLLGSRFENGLAAAEETIESINDFSLPFCLMKLRLLFASECDEDVKGRIYDFVFEAAKSNVQKGQSYWVDVVGTLHADAAQEIRQRAEEHLLSIVFSSDSVPPSPAFEPNTLPIPNVSALVYLRIVEDLSFSVPETGVPSLGPVLLEKMNLVLQKVAYLESSMSNANQDSDHSVTLRHSYAAQESAILFWFYIMLRLVSIHRSSFAPGALPKSDIADQTRLLISISCIALSRTLSSRDPSRPHLFPSTVPLPPTTFLQQTQPEPGTGVNTGTSTNLQVQALDVAATLLDPLPDDARHQCARFLRDRCPPFLHPQNDPRLLALLGPLGTDTQFSAPSQPQPQPQSQQLAPGTVGTPTPSPATPVTPATPTVAGAPAASQQQFYNASSFIPLDDPNSFAGKLRVQQRGRIVGPYPLRPWEMLEAAAPFVGVNDTAVSLGWFGARGVRG
ncbi:hypothetical protein AJ79_08757 [Helicocarpus griseus UAMH5409]|uniref:Mediator of RNA polymerase II transcription subunit 12 n=1 Tax=Helicocarpus griseus UAMH5409 TaxID=1447875 RepID=A0A2B7WQW8_9EURO|nr:hypothetical protein AJ79_08757 [Helicocarpus griseus UAMH5409]